MLGQQIEKLGIGNRPECIWNLDETGFPLDPNNMTTVSLEGQKVVKIVGGTRRENITALAACNAAGESLPPLIVYGLKANIINSIPPEWAGDDNFTLPGTCVSKNEWMTTQVFEDWFKSFALKYNRWIEIGRPENMLEEEKEDDAPEANQIDQPQLESGGAIVEVFFKFLDFKGDGRYYLKPNKVVEKVPARNVFVGPIRHERIKNSGYLLNNVTFEEIGRE
uniref:DDE-1 domain-containing protein n=1 Tax=Romanomermis culicivorax TaxID=13658 RepID=A0A915ICQ0_ROMCU